MSVYSTGTLVSVGDSAKTAPNKTKALTEPRAAAARAFVKAAMARRGMNQVAYAEIVGISQSQLNDFINEKTQGGFAFVEAVADAERVSIDAVVGRAAAFAVPVTMRERAATAALLLGYASDVIEAGVLQSIQHEDARSILRRIQKIDAAPFAIGVDEAKLDQLQQVPRAALAAATEVKPKADEG